MHMDEVYGEQYTSPLVDKIVIYYYFSQFVIALLSNYMLPCGMILEFQKKNTKILIFQIHFRNVD
jgi:hypothetical protein